MNLVRAGLGATADAWQWSGAAVHVAARDDVLVKVTPIRGRVLEYWRDWRTYLRGASAEGSPVKMHLHETTGRPLGTRGFVENLQALVGRTLLPQKGGPKPKRKRKRNQV